MIFKNCYIPITIGIAVFCIYLFTLSPTFTVGDSAELTTAAALLERAHPPGYPLFTLLAHIATWLPIGTIAFRVNLFVALCGSAAVAIFYAGLVLLIQNRAIAVAMTLIFAFSQSVWRQSLSAEVYSLNTLFLCLLFYAALKYHQSSKWHWLWAIVILISLAVTHHLTMIFLIPTLLFFIWKGWHESPHQIPLVVLTSLLISILFASLYLYLPIRSAGNPSQFWGDLTSPATFLAHILGLEFGHYLFEQTSIQFLRRYQSAFWTLGSQIPFFLIKLSLLGLIFAVKNRIWEVVVWALFALISLIFALNYTIPDIEAYYIPVIFVAMILFAYLLKIILESRLKIIAQILILLLPISTLILNYSEVNQNKNYIGYDYSTNVLKSLPQNAVFAADGPNAVFALMYLQFVEHRRLDVKIIDGLVFHYEPDPEILYGQLPLKDRPMASLNDLILSQALRMPAIPHGLIYIDAPLSKPFPFVIRKSEQGLDWQSRNLLARYPLMEGEYLAQKEAELAIEAYRRASKIAHDNKDIRNIVGNAFVSFGKFDEAISEFKVALQLAPEDANTMYHLGSAYLLQKDYQQAEKYLQYAAQLKPTQSQIRNNLGNLYFAQNKIDAAISQYQYVIKMRANDAMGYVNLARCYEKKGIVDLALENYQLALRHDPFTDYREQLEHKINELLSPEYEISSQLERGFEALQQQDFRRAKELFQAVLKQDSLQLQAHIGLAYLTDISANYQEAIPHYEAAISAQPDDVQLRNNFAVVLSKVGQNERAVTLLKNTLKIAPESTMSLNNLGIVDEKMGQLDSAKRQYEAALQIEPTNVAAKQNLEIIQQKKLSN